MCGIVGILGQGPVAGSLVDALKRLEYRGYDSAGLATLEAGILTRRRAEGKLRNLEALLARSRCRARSASAIRAGPPMAGPPRTTPTPTPPTSWPWCITASSRISASCATISPPRAMSSSARPIRKPWRISSPSRSTRECAGTGGRRQPAAAERRVRPGLHLRQPGKPADRRAARRASGGGLWRGRGNVPRLGRPGARRLHRHHHLSGRRRLGDPATRLGGIPQRGQ